MRRSLLITLMAMLALFAVSPVMADNVITYVTTWTDIGVDVSPRGIDVDQDGNVYVADYPGDQVLKYDSNGTLLQTFSTNLVGPGDVAVSPIDGSVYVCETGWPVYDLHKYSPDGVEVDSWLQVDNCLGIEIDSAGNVYTSGYNGYFTKYDANGNQLSSWSLLGVNGVTGLALDPTEAYAYTVRNDTAGVLEKIDLATGTKNSAFAYLDNISNAYGGRGLVAVNSQTGNIYVSERGKNQIEEFDSNGEFVQMWNTFANPGDVVSSSETSSFGTIFDIAYDSNSDRIYIADQAGRIEVFQYGEYVPPQVAGDANKDGKVDGSDVTILAGNWQVGVDGTVEATWEMGDFNGDKKVDGSDVTILAGNWQHGVTTAASAVPEPGTITLLLGTMLSIFWIRCRNRQS